MAGKLPPAVKGLGPESDSSSNRASIRANTEIAVLDLLGGQPSTVEEVYLAYAPSVSRWVQRLGGPRVDVEDAVQEVFAIVQERLAGFRGDSAMRTWLFGITERVVHRALDQRRRKEIPTGNAWDVAGRLPGNNREAFERLNEQEVRTLVYKALDRMTPRYRDALILFELEGMSGEEIAELRGVRSATLWVVLHRARRQFVKRFAEVTRGQQ
jgi:RNA polymerase sigma-70 factor, ECF subfamily